MIDDESRAKEEAIKVACMYLLYEKENETQLRIAFVGLCQERHNNFHVKEGEESDFSECGNAVCRAAVNILREGREPSIEFTPLSVQIVEGYTMRIERNQNMCKVYLVKKGQVEPVILDQNSLKIKV